MCLYEHVCALRQINCRQSTSLTRLYFAPADVFVSLPSALVNYHLLNSVQCSEAIMAGSVYETAEGSAIEIGCDGDSLTVNGIKMVLKKDIVATNGVIHLIDQVLIPDSGKAGAYLVPNNITMKIFCACVMIISFVQQRK